MQDVTDRTIDTPLPLRPQRARVETPRRRVALVGAPEDVARAVRYLLENDYLTGVVLPVDGGFRFGI